MKFSLKGFIGQKGRNMTEGVIWKELLYFSIPTMIGLLFQQLYNTVDAVIVGLYVGKAALAAVGSTGSIINMLVGLCMGLSMGASVVISQCYGSHDDEGLSSAVHTTIVVTFALSAVATVVGILIVPLMLQFMDTPLDVLPEAATYLRIYFCGLSGLLVYNMGSSILRAVGDSARPLFFLVFSAVVNVIFDLIFVVEFSMGVMGAALATILSEFLSAGLILIVLTRSTAPYAIHWKRLSVNKATLRRILTIGLPSGVQQAVTSFSNVFVQSYINGFGSACMAGWSTYNKLDVFVLIPMQSIAMASTTFVGQNFGAGNLPRARKGVKTSLFMSIGITAILAGAMIAFSRPLAMMFSYEADVLEYSVRFLTILSPFYVCCCFNQIFAGALRGVGNSRAPMIIMLLSFVVFRQMYLYVNEVIFSGGFLPVALAYPMGWIVCSAVMTIVYRKSALCHPEEAPLSSRSIYG